MSEPKAEYNVDTTLAKQMKAQREFEATLPAMRAAGVEALKRLVPIALRDTGQSGIVGRFLLGCYNGPEHRFDLTELRGLDFSLHADCLALLQADYAPKKEVHELIPDGQAIFTKLVTMWGR